MQLIATPASLCRKQTPLLVLITALFFTASARAQTTNLALDGTASQSSMAFGGDASAAIDGDTGGVYTAGSVTHTDDLVDSWWQVDLGAAYALETLRIFNRSDCCGARLSNFHISVQQASVEVFGEDFFLGTGSVPQGGMLEISLPADTSGDVVWIGFYGLNNDGNGYLSLAEFEVIGDDGDQFTRGDADEDGVFNISDAIYSLAALFVIGTTQPSCLDSADVNDDGVFDVLDPTLALESLFFAGSPPPPAPAPPVCGLDPTTDSLDCAASICP